MSCSFSLYQVKYKPTIKQYCHKKNNKTPKKYNIKLFLIVFVQSYGCFEFSMYLRVNSYIIFPF